MKVYNVGLELPRRSNPHLGLVTLVSRFFSGLFAANKSARPVAKRLNTGRSTRVMQDHYSDSEAGFNFMSMLPIPPGWSTDINGNPDGTDIFDDGAFFSGRRARG